MMINMIKYDMNLINPWADPFLFDLYRYSILAFRANEDPAATPESCTAILQKAKLENWAMGKTKVKTPHSNIG